MWANSIVYTWQDDDGWYRANVVLNNNKETAIYDKNTGSLWVTDLGREVNLMIHGNIKQAEYWLCAGGYLPA